MSNFPIDSCISSRVSRPEHISFPEAKRRKDAVLPSDKANHRMEAGNWSGS
jgi:hypothetical protein